MAARETGHQSVIGRLWDALSSFAGRRAAERIVFIGDSITEMWAAHPFFRRNPNFIARGNGGETSPYMVARFQADVIDARPVLVHIMAGTNDIAGNSGIETDAEIQNYIGAMVDLARAHGIGVVLASITPALDFPWSPGLHPASRIIGLNRWLQAYARKHRLTYADYWSALATPEGGMRAGYAIDGVHPNARGYAAMRPVAAAAIKRALGTL